MKTFKEWPLARARGLHGPYGIPIDEDRQVFIAGYRRTVPPPVVLSAREPDDPFDVFDLEENECLKNS